MPVGLITGVSRGLGFELARELAERDWELIADARDGTALDRSVAGMPGPGRVTAIPGDVADDDHRSKLALAARRLGRLDLVVNNASVLGPSPQPTLEHYPLDELERVFSVNTFAPLALIQVLWPTLTPASTVINVSSDAAVEAYPGWGGYGSSKAALDQLTAILAAEQPDIRVYAFDPGDMRTTLQQQAFPDEVISDRPEPETVVPALLHLIRRRPASGRYRATDLLATVGSTRT